MILASTLCRCTPVAVGLTCGSWTWWGGPGGPGWSGPGGHCCGEPGWKVLAEVDLARVNLAAVDLARVCGPHLLEVNLACLACGLRLRTQVYARQAGDACLPGIYLRPACHRLVSCLSNVNPSL